MLLLSTMFSGGGAAAVMRRSGAGLATSASRIRVMKPTSPGMRGTVRLDNSHLHKGRPVGSLSFGLRSSGGRNARGRITVRHRGGGHKRRYRIIDFKRSIVDVEGVIERLEYDPNRSAHIALVKYPDDQVLPKQKLAYILAPQGVASGDTVLASRSAEIEVKPGNAMLLRYLPLGTLVHNIEMKPRRGGQMIRSAGLSCELMEKDASTNMAVLKLPSKEERRIRLDCMATVGTVSNAEHQFIQLGKAGASRHRGRRPSVRGVAMNPVDHPMGGGEGKASGGRPSVSPWGKLSKGKKTRDPNKSLRDIVRRRDGRLVK